MSTARKDSIDMTLHPLYGIIVSEQSYLLGLRDLAAIQIADRLVSRITPAEYPVELNHAIADQIARIDERRARERNVAPQVLEERLSRYSVRKRISSGRRLPAERNVVAILKEHNVVVVALSISQPGSKSFERWMHISAAKVRPGLINSVPPLHEDSPALGSLSRLQYGVTYTDRSVIVTAHGDLGARQNGIELQPEDLATDCVSLGSPTGTPVVMTRLLPVDGLEEAVHAWDQESVGRLIRLLRLVVLPLDGRPADSMVPRLRLLHVVETT